MAGWKSCNGVAATRRQPASPEARPRPTRRCLMPRSSAAGIESFNNDPGLLWLRPRTCILARSGASLRSIVVADIPDSRAAVTSSTVNSPSRDSRATNSPSTGASRLPAGAPSTAQQNRNATITGSLYNGDRGTRGRTTRGTSAARNAFRARDRGASPSTTHKSSQNLRLPPADPCPDTAPPTPWTPLCTDSSTIPSTGPTRPATPAWETHHRRIFLDEATTTPRRAFGMSQTRGLAPLYGWGGSCQVT